MWRYLRDTAIFAPCYIALDWASYIAPLGSFNLTPWNPQPALAVAWMLLGGLRYLPAVGLTVFAAEVLVRGFQAGAGITMAMAAALAAGYGAIAWVLRATRGFDPALSSTRGLTVFSGVVTAGTAVLGLVFVGLLAGAGLLSGISFGDAWFRFWIGDAVGVLVTAPLLLVVADARRRAGLRSLAERPESAAQLVLLLGVLWLVFDALAGDPARHFYLLFVPLIWIAERGGLSGAVLATGIVQLGVVLGIHRDSGANLPVVELQALVATLTLTGLFLGVTVEERRRAADELRESLRLAAAGEMAGAIAHEVNQPLTALSTYGRSAMMMIDRGAAEPARLRSILERMLGEAERAGAVVRRLRDFFRTGSTKLEPVGIDTLAAAGRRIGGQVIGSREIELVVDQESDLPAVLADRLQVELVLRNLLANAVEAIAGTDEAAKGRVSISFRRSPRGLLQIAVADDGPGIAASARDRLFEPFYSGKPLGMGLGLSVSRAIAEAHGGALEVLPGPGGNFQVTLPMATRDG
jgi:signal transduction histidine kinase